MKGMCWKYLTGWYFLNNKLLYVTSRPSIYPVRDYLINFFFLSLSFLLSFRVYHFCIRNKNTTKSLSIYLSPAFSLCLPSLSMACTWIRKYILITCTVFDIMQTELMLSEGQNKLTNNEKKKKVEEILSVSMLSNRGRMLRVDIFS